MPIGEAQAAWTAAAGDFRAVSVDGEDAWIHRADLAALAATPPDGSAVRLLPSFDPFLLAHASKDHLIEPRHYKRVYRSQGWLSPVVLRGGRVEGVWRMEAAGRATTLDVRPFARPGRELKSGIHEEAALLGRFLGMPIHVRFTATAAPAPIWYSFGGSAPSR